MPHAIWSSMAAWVPRAKIASASSPSAETASAQPAVGLTVEVPPVAVIVE